MMNFKFKNTVLAALLALTFSAQTSFAEETQAANDNPAPESISIEVPNPQNPEEKVRINVQTTFVDQEAVGDEVKRILESSDRKTLVSSDSKEALEAAIKFPEKVALIPIADASSDPEPGTEHGKVTELLRRISGNFSNALKKDKIGLMIVTYSVGAESLGWIHADNVSAFTKTSGIMYALMTAALLSVDKDARLRYIKPIERKWRKLLRISEDPTQRTKSKNALVSYLSNVTLTMGINLGFIPILAIDKLARGTFEAGQLTMPLLLGFATTAAAFSWYEFFRAIDEKTHPRARKLARLVLNARSITLSTLASTAMLLNTADYGYTPWIALTAAGLGGLPLFFNAARIANWFESSPTMNRISRTYLRIQNIIRPTPPRMCRAIFAGL